MKNREDSDLGAIILVNDSIALKHNLTNGGDLQVLNDPTNFGKITKHVCAFS
jgi:hypothetical protein